MKERPQLGRREIVGVKYTSQKNVCLMRGKNDQEKYLLRKKSSFKYYNTTGSHYNFRGIFIFST